ncbi:hypothetical protein O0L34_g8331 [Tuta absoluta]|nr:hypothetical protein O0L34_g8331 [Tuta absoluta]
MEAREALPRDYIELAGQLTSNGFHGNAFELYLLAFEKEPTLKPQYEAQFRNTLSRLNENLIRNGKAEEAFLNFEKAVQMFPENQYLINDTGRYLYKYGFYMEAWCHFCKALNMDPLFVNPEKNLNSLKNLLVERWHYRMLNDTVRNESYHSAIKDTVVPFKDSVLDLGSGTGLLSLYCLEKSPLSLTACDASEQMVKMNECLFLENGHHKAVIINSMSTEIPCADVQVKSSLLVTELFDAGLFGEHILKSLSHAHEHLLLSDARIIPNRAEFFVVGAKCDHLNNKYQLNTEIKQFLNVPALNMHILTESDTYDCEDVYKFKGLNYMTDPQSLIQIDFNDKNDIHEKITREEPYEVELKALCNGEINVLIGYFNLYLTDKVTVTTDPRSENRANAWQQAVFYDFIPQQVTKDQTIHLEFLLKDDKFQLVPNMTKNVLRISPESLRLLNDTELVKIIKGCLGMASVYLGQMTEMSQINIVDLCPFPLFGVLMLKREIKSLTCWAKTLHDKKFLKRVLKANNIPLTKIKLLSGEDWTQTSFKEEKYHATFCNIFDVCGDVDLRMFAMYNHLRITHLLPGGLFMPSSVNLVGQVVSSHWLDINNQVYDRNTSHYRIGRRINKYQVTQNFCIDYACLEYTALTEPIDMGKYGTVETAAIEVPIIANGNANAVLCWYSIELIEGLGEIATNRGDSFIDGTVFLTSPAVRMIKGNEAHVLRCVDIDGGFKFMIDGDD